VTEPRRGEIVERSDPTGPTNRETGEATRSFANGPLLEVKGIVKGFAATLALDRLDFDVAPGEIHALVGENGAGKTTLIKILAGLYPPEAGQIFFRGREYTPGVGHELAFIHQDLGLFPPFSIAENIAIVAGFPQSRGLISWRQVRERARDLLSVMGSTLDPNDLISTLTSADRSIVAIARALAVDAEVLILDEPTASLPETDVRRLFGILEALKRRGLGIVFVSHRLDEVFRVADRVTVLRDGRKIGTWAMDETSPTHLVYEIVGRDVSTVFLVPPPPSPEVLLEVDNLKVGPAGPVSLRLQRGEVVALVGLRGAGQEIIGRAIFGDTGDWPYTGIIRISGRQVFIKGPADAMRDGVGFVSSKRAEESLAGSLTVRENVYPHLASESSSRFALFRPSVERRRIGAALERHDVRPRDPEKLIGTLSGGNQQKAVLARWLEAQSQILILEEPTFGVDVGAKVEIYALLRRHTMDGDGIVLVSSDFEEVAGIAHRALVFRGGAVVGEIPREELTVSRLVELASGASTGEVENDSR
jgi:ribose transport system ATP-binding protein